jgi:hypothetical protein
MKRILKEVCEILKNTGYDGTCILKKLKYIER